MPPAVGQDATGGPTRHGIGARLDCDDDTVSRSIWWLCRLPPRLPLLSGAADYPL